MPSTEPLKREQLQRLEDMLTALADFIKAPYPNLCTPEGSAQSKSYKSRKEITAVKLEVLSNSLAFKSKMDIDRLNDSQLFLLHMRLADKFHKISPLTAYTLLKKALTTLKPEVVSFESRNQALMRLETYASMHDRLHWQANLRKDAYQTQLDLLRSHKVPYSKTIYETAKSALERTKCKAATTPGAKREAPTSSEGASGSADLYKRR